jgi:hypothetical protein
MCTALDPEVLLLGIYSREFIYIEADIAPRTSDNWKQPNCLITWDWFNKL